MAINAILFVLRIGAQWNALNATGICSNSLAHRWFREWVDAGAFEVFLQRGLLATDMLQGIDWTSLLIDGAMTKAPLGGGKTGPNPTVRGKGGVKRGMLPDGQRKPLALDIDGANRDDMNLVRKTLEDLP